MISRFKPCLGKEELLAAVRRQEGAVTRFEEAFAQTFEARHAIAFPYGRSGLWALFRALGLEGAEVIMPAYTCSVVAHSIVLSDNIPRFVDVTLYDYNMNLDEVEAAINERTRAVIATHLFGYPLDVDRLGEIVRARESRWGHKIWVIQDCAHAFGARWHGKLVCNEGDAAIFGLNISKMITSVFGGMVTTNDADLARRLRGFREEHFVQPTLLKRVRAFLYFLAAYPAFSGHIYRLLNWLQEETTLLDGLTKAYHLDGLIHFPPDYLEGMIAFEAKVGLAQLRKYPQIVQTRRENARYYNDHLRRIPGYDIPPLVDGATYSHYVIRVPDRTVIRRAFRRKGIELGELIEYSVPHFPPYRSYANGHSFANSGLCSHHTVNLPIHSGFRNHQRAQIVDGLRRVAEPSVCRLPFVDHSSR